ncbi:hypothetical protein PCE1_002537 [Barthelona sp. PCE]
MQAPQDYLLSLVGERVHCYINPFLQYEGILHTIDDSLNIVLKDCISTTVNDTPIPIASPLFVKGLNIRHIVPIVHEEEEEA